MKKALLIIGGKSHPFEECGRILAEALQEMGACEMTLSSDLETFTNLTRYDLVVLYTQGGALTPDQESGLVNFVSAGGGLIGIHCASDSFTTNERYLELLGSRFVTHPPITEFEISIADHDHDVTRRCSDFVVVDEFYMLEIKGPPARVLATAKWQFETHPMAYVKTHVKGRVFYFAEGHDERTFSDPNFQKMIYRGVRWVTRQEEGPPLRCGIVGYGPTMIGGESYSWPKHYHAGTITQVSGLELAAICDKDPKRLDVAQGEFPEVATYSSVEHLLASDTIDLAVVATPHNSHAPIALTLLSAGKHVICEKPFCLSVAEADAMIAAARSNGVLVTAYHNRRWDGDFMTIRDVVRDGTIGELFHIEGFAPISAAPFAHPGTLWRSHKPISGGALFDWGSHFVDWILELMPGLVDDVSGTSHKRVWTDVTIEDQVQVIIRFEGGRYAELQLSDIAAVDKPKWRILGTRGGIIADGYDGGASIRVVTHHSRVREERSLSSPERRWHTFYENIADHLLCGEPLTITPERARQVIAIIEAAMSSAKSGNPEQLAPVAYE